MSVVITIIFLLAPFVAIPLLFFGIAIDKKHSIIYGILLALILAIIAYNFNPTEAQDLYRYYFEMDNFYCNINFSRYMEVAFNGTKVIFTLLQFIFSQIGNFRLLPFFITFIGYSITFYIILDYSKLKNVKRYITIFVLIVFICTFYHINFISGLAQYLAISISFLGFYLEYIKGKKGILYKSLYVIPVFIHISLIILLAIRLLLIFEFKKIKRFYFIFLIIYAIVPTILYLILYNIPGMQSIANKINSYMMQGNRGLKDLFDFASLGLILIYTCFFYLGKKKIENEISIKIIDFIEIMLLLNVFSFFYRDIFLRIANIVIISYNLYLILYMNKFKKNIFSLIILIFCFAIGSVNLNNFIANDYNSIFTNIDKNIVYFFKI